MDFDVEGIAILGKITFLDTKSLHEKEEVMKRLISIYESFFVSYINAEDRFFIMLKCNNTFEPLKRAFQSVFAEDIENVIFKILVASIERSDFSTFPRNRTIHYFIISILELSPFELEPLKNDELAKNLILRFLCMAAEECKDSCKPIILPILHVINGILTVIGILRDWPQSLNLTGILNEEGILNTTVFWILAHFSSLASVIDPRMVSSSTFQQLLSDVYFTPSFLFEENKKFSDMQERLFGFFDVKTELKVLLRSPL